MSSAPAGGVMSSPSAVRCMDAHAAPVRATYENLYGWPGSDAEFVKSVSSDEHRQRRPLSEGRQYHPHLRVVDSYSCRQIYLRSYTFSRKETVHERTRRYLGRVKGKVTIAVTCRKGMLTCLLCRDGGGAGKAAAGGRFGKKRRKRGLVIRRMREVSAAALRSLFGRLLSCTAAVDITDGEPF